MISYGNVCIVDLIMLCSIGDANNSQISYSDINYISLSYGNVIITSSLILYSIKVLKLSIILDFL